MSQDKLREALEDLLAANEAVDWVSDDTQDITADEHEAAWEKMRKATEKAKQALAPPQGNEAKLREALTTKDIDTIAQHLLAPSVSTEIACVSILGRIKKALAQPQGNEAKLREAARELLDSARDQNPKDGMFKIHNDFMLGLETALWNAENPSAIAKEGGEL